MCAFSSSSLFELFMKDRVGLFSNSFVSLAIFSSCSLMRASFSSFSVMSFSYMAFMVAISSYYVFIPIIMIGMMATLEDSTLVSDWKTYCSDGEEESLL